MHCARRQAGTTDWPTLLTLHRLLHALAPSLGSGVALAAVTAEIDGPATIAPSPWPLHRTEIDQALRQID